MRSKMVSSRDGVPAGAGSDLGSAALRWVTWPTAQSVPEAVTKCDTLSGLYQMCFSQLWGLEAWDQGPLPGRTLLPVHLPGMRVQGALWGLFYKDTNSIYNLSILVTSQRADLLTPHLGD